MTRPAFVLQQIAHHARLHGDRIALEGPDEALSYGQLERQVTDVAERLRHSGARRLALWMENGPQWLVCQLAAFAAGLCVVPIPPFFSPQQIRHQLKSCGIDLLLWDAAYPLDTLALHHRPRPDIHPRAVVLTPPEADPPASDPPLPPGTALVTFTSGTTGEPKGVCLGLAHLDRLCRSLLPLVTPLAIERHSTLLPLPVLLENVAGALLALCAGARCAVYPAAETGLSGSSRLDPPALARYLARTRPHSLILVPELLQALVGLAEQGALPDGLRLVAVGGGHLPATLLKRAGELQLPVFQGYGLSECGSVVSLNTPGANRIGSVGRPLPHTRVRIAPDGEILIAGSIHLGYMGEPRAGVDQNGEGQTWLASGDLGYLDEAGYLYIHGRKKHLLITSFGRNLSPEWVEAELTASPAITQCCLLGDARPFNLALITPAPGTDAAAIDAWIAACNRDLPDYARVGRWLPTEAPFAPHNRQMTGNGRLRRQAIEAHYRDAIQRSYAEATPIEEHL